MTDARLTAPRAHQRAVAERQSRIERRRATQRLGEHGGVDLAAARRGGAAVDDRVLRQCVHGCSGDPDQLDPADAAFIRAGARRALARIRRLPRRCRAVRSLAVTERTAPCTNDVRAPGRCPRCAGSDLSPRAHRVRVASGAQPVRRRRTRRVRSGRVQASRVTTGSANCSPRSHDTVVSRGAPAVRPTTISGRSTTWETVSADTSSQTSTVVALAVRAAGSDSGASRRAGPARARGEHEDRDHGERREEYRPAAACPPPWSGSGGVLGQSASTRRGQGPARNARTSG